MLLSLQMTGRAVLIRDFRRLGMLTLPPVTPPATLPKTTVKRIAWWIMLIVNILVFWRWGKCFYRTYVVACVLRRWNVPLILNIGVNDPFELKRMRGHCWLTLNNEVFLETCSVEAKYPILTGKLEGQIHYWAGSGGTTTQREILKQA